MTRARWIAALFLAVSLAVPGAGEGQRSEPLLLQLLDVSVDRKADGLVVRIRTSGLPKYQDMLLEGPTRIVIDLEGTTYRWQKSPLVVAADPLREIRGGQYDRDVARVVLELSRKAGYWIMEGPGGLTVGLEPSPADARAKKEPEKLLTRTEPAESPAPEGARRPPRKEPTPGLRAPNPAIKQPAPTVSPPTPVVEVPAPAAPRVAQAAPSQPQEPAAPRLISMDFKDADIVNVLRILAAESGRNIVAGDDVKGKISVSLRNVTWELALDTILETRGLQKIEKDNVIRIVSSEQLAKEREARAKAEEAKIRAQEAKAKAEAEIRTKVAEAQLKEQEVQQRKAASEAARAEALARGPLKEETIRLMYGDPEEVAKTLQGILGIPPEGVKVSPVTGPPPILEQPFAQLYGIGPALAVPPPPAPAPPEVLAKGITIRPHKPTNSIFIRHYEADLERIKKLIREKLDVPLPQVKIEARMEILDRTALEAIGIQWGGAGTRRTGENVLVGQGFAPTGAARQRGIAPTETTDPFVNPNLTLGTTDAEKAAGTGLLPIDASTGLPTGSNIVNLPFSVLPNAASQIPAGSIAFGIVGTRFNLNLALQALETQGKSKSLARPEIVTVENNKAIMSLGEEIPYATVSSAGTQIQFKEALLKLEVTPTVIRDTDASRIKMKVVVENNSRGAVVDLGASGAPPAINRRKAETEVIIKEGELLVIGGVTQRTASETVRKVPLLGDVPLLGWLFKAREINVDPDRELVVFIKPVILRNLPSRGLPAQQQPGARPKGS